MTKKVHINPRIIAGALIIGILCSRIPSDSLQKSHGLLIDNAGVGFLLLSGGYVLLKCRDEDIAYYRSASPDNEETRRRLLKRRRLIGIAGWALAASGLIWVVVLGWNLALHGLR